MTLEIAERLAAYANAEIAGRVGRTGQVVRAPASGWAGARIVHLRKNAWEPAIAADPASPWVYIAVTRFGSPRLPALPRRGDHDRAFP